jgi:teichoic acid glycerol-phosphate primase
MICHKKSSGLIFGDHPIYIDHLAPLCSLMNIPLFVSEEKIFQLLAKYYPALSVELLNPLRLPEQIALDYEAVIHCLPRPLFDEIFFLAERLVGKKLISIWCPHGNSDKGHQSYFMENLKEETHLLVYGEKMIDFLKEKKVFSQLPDIEMIGNYRYDYFLRHRRFYHDLLEKKILSKLPKNKKNILYAPTWDDCENSSSLSLCYDYLIRALPEDFNLIIKPHPNTFIQSPDLLDKLREKEKPNLLLLEEFPPIYPLLEAIDIYLGDFSSIGYDFLCFNKPLFFLNVSGRNPQNDKGLYLYRCGIEIRDLEKTYEEIRKNKRDFSQIRAEVYHYTFGSYVPA